MTEEILTAKVEIASALANIRQLADAIRDLKQKAGTPATINIGTGVGGGRRVGLGGMMAGMGIPAGGGIPTIPTGGGEKPPKPPKLPSYRSLLVPPEEEKKGRSMFNQAYSGFLRSLSILFLVRRLFIMVEQAISFGAKTLFKAFTGILQATEKWRVTEIKVAAVVGKAPAKELQALAFRKGIELPGGTPAEFMASLTRATQLIPSFQKAMRGDPKTREKYGTMWIETVSRLMALRPGTSEEAVTSALLKAVGSRQWTTLQRSFQITPKLVTGGMIPQAGLPTLEAISKYTTKILPLTELKKIDMLVSEMWGDIKSIFEEVNVRIGNVGQNLYNTVARDLHMISLEWLGMINSPEAQKSFVAISDFFVDKFKRSIGFVRRLFKDVEIPALLGVEGGKKQDEAGRQLSRNATKELVEGVEKGVALVVTGGTKWSLQFVSDVVAEAAKDILGMTAYLPFKAAHELRGLAELPQHRIARYKEETEYKGRRFNYESLPIFDYFHDLQIENWGRKTRRAELERQRQAFGSPARETLLEGVPAVLPTKPQDSLRTGINIGKISVDEFLLNRPIRQRVTPLEAYSSWGHIPFGDMFQDIFG